MAHVTFYRTPLILGFVHPQCVDPMSRLRSYAARIRCMGWADGQFSAALTRLNLAFLGKDTLPPTNTEVHRPLQNDKTFLLKRGFVHKPMSVGGRVNEWERSTSHSSGIHSLQM